MWKLDNNRLTNKERLWKFQSFGNPNEYWNFIANNDLIYIEAAHQFGCVISIHFKAGLCFGPCNPSKWEADICG